jgi:hypothetical protein
MRPTKNPTEKPIMSTANLKPKPYAKRINTGNRKLRKGFMTLAMRQGVEIAIYHPTMLGLENAFNLVTEGRVPFDRSMVSCVEINNQPKGVKQ